MTEINEIRTTGASGILEVIYRAREWDEGIGAEAGMLNVRPSLLLIANGLLISRRCVMILGPESGVLL